MRMQKSIIEGHRNTRHLRLRSNSKLLCSNPPSPNSNPRMDPMAASDHRTQQKYACFVLLHFHILDSDAKYRVLPCRGFSYLKYCPSFVLSGAWDEYERSDFIRYSAALFVIVMGEESSKPVNCLVLPRVTGLKSPSSCQLISRNLGLLDRKESRRRVRRNHMLRGVFRDEGAM